MHGAGWWIINHPVRRNVHFSIWGHVDFPVRRHVHFPIWRPFHFSIWRAVNVAIWRPVDISIWGAVHFPTRWPFHVFRRRNVYFFVQRLSKQYSSLACLPEGTRIEGISVSGGPYPSTLAQFPLARKLLLEIGAVPTRLYWTFRD
jgi:hypothetical protein